MIFFRVKTLRQFLVSHLISAVSINDQYLSSASKVAKVNAFAFVIQPAKFIIEPKLDAAQCSHAGFFKLNGPHRIFCYLVADAAAAFNFQLFKIRIKLFIAGQCKSGLNDTLTTSASPFGFTER